MDERTLTGRTYTVASATPAAALASFVLSDLGADIRQAPPGTDADIGDRAGGAAPRSVALDAYVARGRFSTAPTHESAVLAIGGALMGQYTYADGPAYLVTPYASVGQALLATAATLAHGLQPAAPALPVSTLQGLLALQTGHYAFGPQADPARWRSSPRGQLFSYSTYRAADDWIFLGASTHVFMIKVLQALGLYDVLDDPRTHEGPRAFKGTPFEAELWERLGAVIRQRPRDHWLALFERAGIPAGPVLSLEEALAHPQIAAAGLAEPGEPVGRLTNLVRVTRRGEAAPRPVEDDGPRPLSGLRVVELAGYIAGSYAGRLLADLGTDVVKIEPPDGDPLRVLDYGFVAWNHGKTGLALNLRDGAGRARLLDLVREADVLVTNYRPEALARMGVGRDDLFAINPALIHCTISAFGESGPLAHLPGFDPVVQGFAGIMKRQGGDDEPVKPQIAATDYLSGMLSCIGVLAARTAQREQGGGYVVQTSLLAAALLLNEPAYADVRAGRSYLIGGRDFRGPHPLNALHATRDGWLLAVAPDAQESAAVASALRYLGGGTSGDTTEEAIATLRRFDLPAVPALHPDHLPSEPHFLENALWLTVEQPDQGALTFPAPVLGPPHAAPAPAVGAHNALASPWRV